MRSKASVLLALIGLALASCSPSGGAPHRAERVPDELLMLRTTTGPMTVEVPSGAVRFERDGAITSPDGSLVYSASVRRGRTTIETDDAATGARVATADVRGTFDLAAVSGSGRSVALVEPLPRGWDPTVPVPRSRTTIVVADPTGQREPVTFDLRGNYEPEAFSTDDGKLFLIQHLPAEAPAVYRVTQLDLALGDVYPVIGPYKGPPERMPGTRLEQVLAPDATRLYTLYSSTRPGYAPHDAPVPENASVSFVHVLDLHEGWAHCVGLPRQLWDRPAAEQAMAVSPDGTTLYVLDPSLGVIASMDTDTLETHVETHVAFGDVSARDAAAQVSADGSTLYVVAGGGAGSVLLEVDTGSFDVLGRSALAGQISGLGLSADGQRLYAANAEDLSILDPTSGVALAEVPLGATGAVLRVVPLAG